MKRLAFILSGFLLAVAQGADILATREPFQSYPTIWQQAGAVPGTADLPDTSGWATVNMVTTHGVDPTGVTSIVSTTNSVISALSATANTILYFPPGTYLVDGQINLNKNSVMIAGLNDPSVTTTAPGDRTVFNMTTGSSLVYMGISSGWTGAQNITGDYDPGDTVLTVASSTGYAAGAMVRIWQDNNTTLIDPNDNPITRWLGGEQLQGQITRVVSTTPTTITISPGLHFPLSASRNPQIYRNSLYRTKIGLKYLYFNNASRSAGGFSWRMNCTMDSWVDSCYIYETRGTASYINFGLQNTVVHTTYYESQIDITGNPNNAGIKIDVGSSNLIANNIGFKQFPLVQINGQLLATLAPQGGSSANVVVDNFNYQPGNTDSVVGLGYTSHDSQTTGDLFESNYGAKMELDAYFGSAQWTTISRNWWTGVDASGVHTSLAIAVELNRGSRYVNVVGNLLGLDGYTFTVDPEYAVSGSPSTNLIYRNGFPNTSNATFSGTASPIAGDWWTNWDVTGTLTTRTSDTAGTVTVSGLGTVTTGMTGVSVQWSGGLRTGVTIGTVSGASVPFSGGSGTVLPATSTAMEIWAGPGGFQERDLDVYGTMLLKGNYNTQDDAIPASESLAGATVADSYVYSAKPAYYGSLDWPAYDSGTPNFDPEAIPSGYRYYNGVDPAAGPPGPDAPTGLNATAVGNRSVSLSWADESGGTGSFEIERSTTGGGVGFAQIGTTEANVVAFSDTNVAVSTTYYYRVRCVNNEGNSAYSSEDSVLTGAAGPTNVQRNASSNFSP